MNLRKFAGLGLLIAVMLLVVGFKLLQGDDPQPTPSVQSTSTVQPTQPVVANAITAHGIIGKGKRSFINDPDVVRLLKDKYGITVAIDEEVGSYKQVTDCVEKQETIDFCWPSSENAGMEIQAQVISGAAQSAIIFNSPIVLYTWAPIADALIAQGVVTKKGDTYFADLANLIELINKGTPWSSIGLPSLFGGVTIYSTDPSTSNTGYSFAGLLANTLNGGNVVDQSTVAAITPNVQAFFNRMGYLPPTTAPFFEQFLNLGMGAAPIIVAYESNLIEFSLQHPDAATQQYLLDNVRTLYPIPTVWSAQPVIALNDNGQRLMNALRDPEIQRIGWEHHGFRHGVPGSLATPTVASLSGVPSSIDSVTTMPKPKVMDRIVEAIAATPEAAFTREELLL